MWLERDLGVIRKRVTIEAAKVGERERNKQTDIEEREENSGLNFGEEVGGRRIRKGSKRGTKMIQCHGNQERREV